MSEQYPEDAWGIKATASIRMTVPLLILMLEWAREKADDDEDVHEVVEKAIELNQDGGVLTVDCFESMIEEDEEETTILGSAA